MGVWRQHDRKYWEDPVVVPQERNDEDVTESYSNDMVESGFIKHVRIAAWMWKSETLESEN